MTNESPEHKEQRREKQLEKIIKGITLYNDNLAKNVYQGEKGRLAMQDVVRIILGNKNLELIDVKTQENLKFPGMGRGVIFDVYAKDSNGKYYDIEIQQSLTLDFPKRLRYNASVLNIHSMNDASKEGRIKDYNELPDTCLIVLDSHDRFNNGNPLYHVKKIIEETGVKIEDGEAFIFLNGNYRLEAQDIEKWNEIEKLIHDLRCNDPQKMLIPSLKDRMIFFKETKEGVKQMKLAMRPEYRVVADELREESKGEVALKLRKYGVDPEIIERCTGLDAEKLDKLAKEQEQKKGQSKGFEL